jgi:hypothetical protein
VLLTVLATGSIAMWLAVNTEINEENSMLRQQASVRPLARKLLGQPDLDRALVFSAEARVHGLEFYLRRCVSTTRDDADIVLDVEPSQQPRLLKNVGWCATELLAGQPAYGLVRTGRFEEKFAPLGWREVARSGDFVLVANRTSAGVSGK